MSKQFKLIIFANAILTVLFVACNFIYSTFSIGNHSAQWSPLWLTFYNDQAAATIGDIGA